jgi:hypothetical protein
MATTTPNFGWAVPTSTDLVKDGAVAIETLGDSIDASLVDLKGGTTGQVLAKASGTDMDFTWVAQDDSNAIQNAIVDAKGDIIVATAADTPARLAVGADGQVLKANSATATGLEWSADSAGMTNPMTTTGDTIYSSSGSTPARLAIGTTGQVLTVAGGIPSWATPAGGGGKVLQVVQGTSTAYGSSTSGTYADTGLSATITPSATSSKILVLVAQHIAAQGNGSNHGMVALNLVRTSTQIQEMNYNCGLVSNAFTLGVPAALTYLDSPNTTSATTYKTQFMRPTGSGTAIVNNGSNPAAIVLIEIGA